MVIKVGDLAFEPMLSHQQIQEQIQRLGECLNRDYEHQNPLFIGILSGCFMFMGDLMKVVTIPSEISFLKLSSYKGDRSTGKINLELGLNIPIANREVIIVEDIVDTGHTLNFLLEMLQKEKPGSISICSLLHKAEACQYQFTELKYIGFEIPNRFVVGYGLDYNGLGRNMKDIYQLATN